jgi:hypothetical protein
VPTDLNRELAQIHRAQLKLRHHRDVRLENLDGEKLADVSPATLAKRDVNRNAPIALQHRRSIVDTGHKKSRKERVTLAKTDSAAGLTAATGTGNRQARAQLIMAAARLAPRHCQLRHIAAAGDVAMSVANSAKRASRRQSSAHTSRGRTADTDVADAPAAAAALRGSANANDRLDQESKTMLSRNVGLKRLTPSGGAPTNHRRLRACLAASVVVLAGVGVAGPAFAQSAYDGSWSVVISTRGGACESGVRYGVQIINGHVTSAGEGGGVDVAGRVSRGGAVNVAVRSGGQWANGSGRLSMTHGGGVWRGQGNSGFCQGTWAAERTGASAQAEMPQRPLYNYAPRYYRAMPPGEGPYYAPMPGGPMPGDQW